MKKTLDDLAGKIFICDEARDFGSITNYRNLPCIGSWPKTKQRHPEQLVENLNKYIKKNQGDKFNFIEAVSTFNEWSVIEGAITDRIPIYAQYVAIGDLKDLACVTNKVLKDKFLIEENNVLTKNFNAVMVDFSVYYEVIPGIMEFNKYKNHPF